MYKPAYIYALAEPSTGDVRYIGKSVDPLGRLKEHLKKRGSNAHLNNWVRVLENHGLKPRMYVLEGPCSDDDWRGSERRWIALYRAEGARLINLTSGGDGLCDPTGEIRAKIAKAITGKTHSPETLEKLREAHRRREPLQCSICGKLVKGKHNLVQHEKACPAQLARGPSFPMSSPEYREKQRVLAKQNGSEVYLQTPEAKEKRRVIQQSSEFAEKVRAVRLLQPFVACAYCGKLIRGNGPLLCHERVCITKEPARILTGDERWYPGLMAMHSQYYTCPDCGRTIRGKGPYVRHKCRL